jgi:hypothetical protein
LAAGNVIFKSAIVPAFFSEMKSMVSIEFTKNASYDVATDKGGKETVNIAAGTVKHGLSESEAHRWERRGVAKRVTGRVEAAPMPPAPPAGIPEGNDPGTPGVTPAAPVPPAPPAPPAPPTGGEGEKSDQDKTPKRGGKLAAQIAARDDKGNG